VLRVCSTLLQVTGVLEGDIYMWKPPSGLSEDFLYVADIELIYNSHQKCFTKERFTTYYQFMYINVHHDNI
jgi:hypothetical protein